MNQPLTSQQRERIDQKVQSGLYGSRDEVLDKALDLLDEYDEELAGMRENVRIAEEQVRNGQYTDYSDETLHQLFDKIDQRGRRWLASRDTDHA